jgi:hypothetical protein
MFMLHAPAGMLLDVGTGDVAAVFHCFHRTYQWFFISKDYQEGRKATVTNDLRGFWSGTHTPWSGTHTPKICKMTGKTEKRRSGTHTLLRH